MSQKENHQSHSVIANKKLGYFAHEKFVKTLDEQVKTSSCNHLKLSLLRVAKVLNPYFLEIKKYQDIIAKLQKESFSKDSPEEHEASKKEHEEKIAEAQKKIEELFHSLIPIPLIKVSEVSADLSADVLTALDELFV